ncbi:DUF493 family protein [Mesonia ostreae]|uniref:DUF493 family protein n=1 Tax=Mesonia ostreae TaxID=861110 RepID=A0ABU2KEG1_9FLAO|nr:DUF493 family protein [Mesonia ostreae]MDT0293090.1 DUF493 family protein [Mesonia ostreae]
MSANKERDDFYKNLKVKLAETAEWPSEYLYKFIVPSKNEKIAEVENIFDNMGAVITTKESSKGTYTSVSVSVKIESPEMVIEKYIEVGEKVEGVISL